MARLSEAQNTRNVLILTGVGRFSSHFFELMFPTLAVALAAQTHWPLEEVLGWSFLGYLLFGLGALPAGLLADRVSPRLLLIVALFGLGVSALAASEAHNGRALSLSLAAMGACASVYHPIGLRLVSASNDARGRARGVDGLAGNAAIALTPLVTAALATHLGWQSTYRLVGYGMCAVAVACEFVTVDDRHTHHATPTVAVAARPPFLAFAVLLVAATLAGVSYRGNTLVQPGYFAAHVSEMGFGAATSLAYVLGIGGQYVARALADRHDPRRLYLAFHACSLPALLLMTRVSGLPLLAAAAVFAFFSLGMQPIENSLFAQLAPPRWRANAYSLRFVLVFGGGALAVWLVRWAGGLGGGLTYALLALAVVVALVIAAATVLVRLGDPVGGRRAVAPEVAGGAATNAPAAHP